jgi:YegS/Rv2252/BmrU family lipid kinase
VIFNPAAQGDQARRFRRELEALEGECTLKPSTGPGAARALATEAVREAAETIVATGGDGTVNEVLNGIADVSDGFTRVRLGVIPLGTANVFARDHRIPRNVRRAWEVVRGGREVSVDLPVAEFVAPGGGTVRRYFAQLAGAGVDARAVELVNWQLKKQAGWGAYVLAGLRAVAEKHVPITASAEGQTHTGDQIVIGNGQLYGGPFVLFPEANPRDGLLDVCVLPSVRWGTVLACCWGLVTSRLHRVGGARHFQAEAFTLTAPARVPLELDGECVGELPAKFSLLPRALRLIVP